MKWLLTIFTCILSLTAVSQNSHRATFNIGSFLASEISSAEDTFKYRQLTELSDGLINYPDSGITKHGYYVLASSYLYHNRTDIAEAMMRDIISKYPGDCVYGEATGKLGAILIKKGDTSGGIQLLEEYIANETFDSLHCDPPNEYIENVDWNMVGKFDACHELVALFSQLQQYKKVIHYLDLIQNRYRYQSFCGAGDVDRDLYIRNRYKEAYLGLGDTSSAISALLEMQYYSHPEIYRSSFYDSLNKLLLYKYDQRYIKEQLKNAENTIEIVLSDNESYYDVYITLFGHRIYFTDMRVRSKPLSQDEYLAAAKRAYLESWFYKYINERL